MKLHRHRRWECPILDEAPQHGRGPSADAIADAGAEIYASLCADGVATSGAEFLPDGGAYACTDSLVAACPSGTHDQTAA